MHALFCTFFPVLAMQKLLKLVKIWQSCSQMYTATFYEPRQKCRLSFFQVRCAHKSGDMINVIIVACVIFSRLKWYKNCKNRLRLAKVIVKNKVSHFYGSLCIFREHQILIHVNFCNCPLPRVYLHRISTLQWYDIQYSWYCVM